MGIPTRRTIAREAVGVVGAITPWNFPHQINLAKIGPALAAGQHRRPQARPRHTLVRGRARRTHRRAHRLPAGRDQHRHLQRPRRRRAAVERPSGGHGFVHRVDGHRPRRDGRRRRDHQEGLPRTGRQVGVHRARRRGPGRRVRRCRRSRYACTPGRAARSPPGWWCRGPATTRPSPCGRGDDGRHQGRRPDRHGNHLRPSDFGAPARPGAGLSRLGDRRGRHVRVRWRSARRP